jgi:hypothetical protein
MIRSSAKVGQDGILSHDQFASFQSVSDAEMKDSFVSAFPLVFTCLKDFQKDDQLIGD